MSDDRWQGFIRMLIYPIQFDENPIDSVDRVAAMVTKRSDQYIPAIQAALQSTERLSDLIPQPHSEATIRAYLFKMQSHLESQKS